MAIERREKDRCPHCNGEKMTWRSGRKLKIICLICGHEFDARREEDLHKFHKEAEDYK